MNQKRFFTRLFIISGLWATLLTASCQPALNQNAYDAGASFAALEQILRENYILNPEGNQALLQANFGRNYLAALKTISADRTLDPARGPREQLTDSLSSLPAREQHRAIYMALTAFMQSLPLGDNSVSNPLIQKSMATNQKSGSAGLILKKHHGQYLVADVLEGSGSYRENLYPGLILIGVADQRIYDRTFEEIVHSIRGVPGSNVQLEFKGLAPVKVQRDRIGWTAIQKSTWQIGSAKQVVHIMLRSVDESSSLQVESLIKQHTNIKAVILDLRKLHQGTYSDCLNLADAFRGPGPGSHLQDRNGDVLAEYSIKKQRLLSAALYVLTGAESTACALLIADTLKGTRGITTIGTSMPVAAFHYEQAELPGGWQINYARAFLYNKKQEKAYYQIRYQPDIEIAAPLPRNAPLQAPDPLDPLQIYLARLWKIAPN